MTEKLGFLYLLLTLWVQNTKENGGVKEDNRANPESPQNNASCSKIVKGIKIYSPTPEITIGAKVKLVCYLETNCLPINYTLFLKKKRVQGPAPQSMKKQKVEFNTTIHSNSQLGPYKCKADYLNRTMASTYSPAFNFTLRVVTIQLLILPWCKARKLKSANICTAYDDTGENQLDNEDCMDYEITEYYNLKMKIKTDDRYVNDSEDSVTYAEVICK
ncbi:uncharacterized protein LOC131193357 [Ahaetulla prasina]|uniref:uncharacterized protein LOC131193357 n=1 Tax=Ahaetulla prasina TaxID=499056 RepID=UPI0026498134|nr:uncharacterized protein LOC131193357 [Ahaetulla prasina]